VPVSQPFLLCAHLFPEQIISKSTNVRGIEAN
jgi:hypothetical protein